MRDVQCLVAGMRALGKLNSVICGLLAQRDTIALLYAIRPYRFHHTVQGHQPVTVAYRPTCKLTAFMSMHAPT